MNRNKFRPYAINSEIKTGIANIVKDKHTKRTKVLYTEELSNAHMIDKIEGILDKKMTTMRQEEDMQKEWEHPEKAIQETCAI